jgi:hypothetical protein
LPRSTNGWSATKRASGGKRSMRRRPRRRRGGFTFSAATSFRSTTRSWALPASTTSRSLAQCSSMDALVGLNLWPSDVPHDKQRLGIGTPLGTTLQIGLDARGLSARCVLNYGQRSPPAAAAGRSSLLASGVSRIRSRLGSEAIRRVRRASASVRSADHFSAFPHCPLSRSTRARRRWVVSKRRPAAAYARSRSSPSPWTPSRAGIPSRR